MIVYNVQRQWFTMKADADTYRKAQGLPPAALGSVRCDSREDLAAILNALCEEPTRPADLRSPLQYASHKQVGADTAIIAPAIVDRAFIWNDPEIPLFLRVDYARRNGKEPPTE